MVQYCRKCGAKLDDNDEFCTECGHKINENPNPTSSKNINNEFISKAPTIIALIAVIIGIGESFSTPVLMGWSSILTSLLITIIGGIIGVIVLEFLNEPVIATIEFILTAGIIFIFIGRFGEISAIVFIIAGILTLYFKGTEFKNKKTLLIPVLTIVLLFILLIVTGGISLLSPEDSVSVGNVTANINNDGFGYYDGNVSGDITTKANFDYLCVNVNFYDAQGKVIDSTIGWNQINPDNGKTYKFSAYYFKNTLPVKAEISVVDEADSTTPLYSENVTVTTGSGV